MITKRKTRRPPYHERTPVQSKKFIAFLVSDISWTIITLYMLWIIHEGLLRHVNGELNSVLASMVTLLMAVIIVSGFVQAGYIINQTALDKYVRVAHILHGKDTLESEEEELELKKDEDT